MMLPVSLLRAIIFVVVVTKTLPLKTATKLCMPFMGVFHRMPGASGAGPSEKRVKAESP
jgi:hypothetical protein